MIAQALAQDSAQAFLSGAEAATSAASGRGAASSRLCGPGSAGYGIFPNDGGWLQPMERDRLQRRLPPTGTRRH